MSEVAVSINARTYNIACDEGEEQRVLELAAYIDKTLRDIAKAGAATNDSHLLVLTSLVIADQLFDSGQGRRPQNTSSSAGVDEQTLIKVIDHLTERVDAIASKYADAA